MSRPLHDAAVSLEIPREETEQGIVSDILALTKARLSLLVVITTFVGFCMASGPRIDWLLLIHAVLGTTLAAAEPSDRCSRGLGDRARRRRPLGGRGDLPVVPHDVAHRHGDDGNTGRSEVAGGQRPV